MSKRKILSISKDKSIEGIKSKKEKILGIMWHPEREKKFNSFNKKNFKKFFFHKNESINISSWQGRRLPSHLSKKPKVLLNINNKSILDKLIKNFQSVGINKIALITGFNRKSLKKYKLKEFHNKKWSKTNMVYSLCKADSWLKKYSCIVSYGDIIYEAKALKKLCKNKNNITLSYDINWKKLWKMRFENPLNDAETFKIKKNLIKDIGKKTKNILDIQGQYMGLIKFYTQRLGAI